jgi:hypothetical protein
MDFAKIYAALRDSGDSQGLSLSEPQTLATCTMSTPEDER